MFSLGVWIVLLVSQVLLMAWAVAWAARAVGSRRGRFGVALLVVLGLVVRPFVTEAFNLPSKSMAPTIVEGDRFFVNKLLTPRRWDVVAYMTTVPAGGRADVPVFLIGDNVNASADSRLHGPSDRSQIVGVVDFRYWPLERIGLLR